MVKKRRKKYLIGEACRFTIDIPIALRNKLRLLSALEEKSMREIVLKSIIRATQRLPNARELYKDKKD